VRKPTTSAQKKKQEKCRYKQGLATRQQQARYKAAASRIVESIRPTTTNPTQEEN